jgi:hypothetical protein
MLERLNTVYIFNAPRSSGIQTPATWNCDLQFENLGMDTVTKLIPLLSPSPDPTDTSGTPEHTAATLTRTTHHILALHALASLLTADVSSTLTTRLQGVLSAVLENLGDLTEKRLLAAPQFQLQNFRLVEAHLLVLQVCRECTRLGLLHTPCALVILSAACVQAD